MAAFSPLSLTSLFDETGAPLVGARIEIFDAGTLTPRNAYKDAALNTPHPRPIETNATGRIPPIWISGETAYRARLSTPDGSLVEDIDDIPGEVSGGGGGGGGGGDEQWDTGDYLWSHRTGVRAGWARCNGRTLGSATSGATERANADAEDLYVHLWNADASLAVTGGRGGTAEADWAANKPMALPDIRGRPLVGLDDMGNTAAGRLVGATFGTGNATTLGSVGGTGVETLLTTQIPAHGHSGVTQIDGTHQHSGLTSFTGAHFHSGTTDVQGDHGHAISVARLSALLNGGGSPFWNATPGGDTFGTLNAGAHVHNFLTASAGDHNHSFFTDFGGSHAHAFTSANTGGGGAHNNMPPFLLATCYIRL